MERAAVIQCFDYLNIRNAKSYVAWVYDMSRPLRIESDDPKERFACVDMLGPFKTLDAARRACESAGIGDD